MRSIDLNCDMGEGMGQEEILFPFISSVNIACGGHAGGEDIMRSMVELALTHRVAVGAHPSYPDRANFGRIDWFDLGLSPGDLTTIILEQLYRLQKVCFESGTAIHHVKPHGALYNRAARDRIVASVIGSAVKEFNPGLLLYGLSGSEMEVEAEAYGLPFVREAFADRSYQDDGSLTPRTEPGALIDDPPSAVRQVLQIARDKSVRAQSGKQIFLRADTICLHGDGAQAPLLAQRIHESLRQQGIQVRAPSPTR